MAEKYFEVTSKNKLYTDYYNYIKNNNNVELMCRTLLEKNKIETTIYGYKNDKIYIVPTNNDKKNFEKQLCKKVEKSSGLVAFKKTSNIDKIWLSYKVNILKNPEIKEYFSEETSFFVTKAVFWNKNNRLFYSCVFSDSNIILPDGFEEMTKEDFFKIWNSK